MRVKPLPTGAALHGQRMPRVAMSMLVRVLVLVWLPALLALTACGEKKKKDRPETAAAARVNREDITLAQINQVLLLQQRSLRPDQADATSRQILEWLIDQELAVQKAGELKLDRDPRVVLQLEAARREVLARAHAEKVAEPAARPTADDVHQYYEQKAERFKERRTFVLQELVLEAKPEQVAELRNLLGTAPSTSAVFDYLKSRNIRFQVAQVTRSSDQLPQASLEALNKMNNGQVRMESGPNGAQLLALVSSASQPVTEEQARPAIEQILLAERRRKLVEEELKQLRSSARIEYFGKFAEDRNGAPAPSASAASGGS